MTYLYFPQPSISNCNNGTLCSKERKYHSLPNLKLPSKICSGGIEVPGILSIHIGGSNSSIYTFLIALYGIFNFHFSAKTLSTPFNLSTNSSSSKWTFLVIKSTSLTVSIHTFLTYFNTYRNRKPDQ